MRKFWENKIIKSFLIWRVGLFVIAFLAALIIPFGNSFPYVERLTVSGLPSWIWGFANFDGVHYIHIAETGYSDQYTQAFFPLYPLLIKFITLGNYFLMSGLILSSIFFLAALFVLYKLYKIDYDEKVSWKAVLLLIAFPTAFYFAAVYTESAFLFFSVMSLYLMRKGQFLLAGLFVMLASATRVVGILLVPVLLLELFLFIRHHKNSQLLIQGILGVLVAPLGLIFYMLYLNHTFHDPLYFLHSQAVFGRSKEPFVLLPQVLFRYIKIFFTVSPQVSQFYIALLEFISTVSVIALLLGGIKKIRPSYLLFTLGLILVPTLTGTLLSMPRFILMTYLLLPFLVMLTGRYYKVVLTLFIITQIVLSVMFLRGYWVA